MRYFLVIAIAIVSFGIFSCTKYKATLVVEVTDTLNNPIDKAEVYLMEESEARDFEMGLKQEPNTYFSGSTMSDGTTKIKITDMQPIFGIVAKQGYYYKEFYIEKPLKLRSKSKIIVKLVPMQNQY